MYTLNLDDGYSFGLGIFETIALKNQRPVFPEEHLKRLFHSLDKLHIENPQVGELLTANRLSQEAARCPYPKGVLKISVSERNLLFSCRENTYTEDQYQRGFHVQLSPVLRNETSPLTYHKTLNYGDNILEKRRAHREAFNEPIFLNTQGQICEGATTNLFFVKKEKLFTPQTECGLLNGILRDYILRHYPVTQTVIRPEQVFDYEEIFLTNSLLGIMPVSVWNQTPLSEHALTDKLRKEYEEYLNHLI